ncbi:MAG: LCP family protein [Clostridia bacterium]|nr:LCP family protein [Clostridia bacterium]
MNNLRNFGIVFAVSFIVLGIIALFACGYVADTVAGIFTDDGDELEQILRPDGADTTGIGTNGEDDRLTRKLNGESFTWLVIVSDYRPEVFDNYYPLSGDDVDSLEDDFGILGEEYRYIKASNIALIRADVKTREYVIMSFPTATRVSTPSGNMSLADVYAFNGAEVLAQEVGSLTGLTVDYYSVIHSTELPSLANTIGSIDCNIPVDIAFDGENYVKAPPEIPVDSNTNAEEDEESSDESTEPETTYVSELDKASSVKLAKKLPAALLFYDSTDGIDDEMLILQSFVNGMMLNLSEKSDGDLTSIFTSISKKLVSTNITKDDVLAHTEVIRGYSWFKVQTLTYPGRYITGRQGRDGYYNPDIDAAISFFASYR